MERKEIELTNRKGDNELVKKRIILFAIVFAVLFLCQKTCILADEGTVHISLPTDPNATIVNFTKRYYFYVRNTKTTQTDVKMLAALGRVSYFVGQYHVNRLIDQNFYDGVIVKVCMEPLEYPTYLKSNGFGWSEYLEIKSNLNSVCTVQSNYPTNSTSGSKSYSGTISIGSQASNLSFSVSNNAKYCNVVNKSQSANNIFHILYDYNPPFINFNASVNAIYFDETWQMASCAWTCPPLEDNQVYTISVKIKASFCTSKHYGVNWMDPGPGFNDSQSLLLVYRKNYN